MTTRFRRNPDPEEIAQSPAPADCEITVQRDGPEPARRPRAEIGGQKLGWNDDPWVFYYDGDCGLCRSTVRILARLDWLKALRWVPFQELETPPSGLSWGDLDNAAYLRTGGGRLWTGFYAMRHLCLRIPFLLPMVPILWFPGASLIGPRIYRWVANNRYWISRCRW